MLQVSRSDEVTIEGFEFSPDTERKKCVHTDSAPKSTTGQSQPDSARQGSQGRGGSTQPGPGAPHSSPSGEKTETQKLLEEARKRAANAEQEHKKHSKEFQSKVEETKEKAQRETEEREEKKAPGRKDCGAEEGRM
jgi:hypothetical protein